MSKHWKRTLALLAVAVAAGLACGGLALGGKKPPAPPPPPQPTISYSITFLGTLLGDTTSQARDVNEFGQVVGFSTGANGSRAFLYSVSDGMVALNDLIDPASGWVLGWATSINDAGQIVGLGKLNGQSRAYRFTPGVGEAPPVVEDLGTFGGGSEAYGINAHGDVAGRSTDFNGNLRAFVWTDQTGMVDIGDLGGGLAFAEGINNSGQVTGGSTIGATWLRAFRYTPGVGGLPGVMEDLGDLATLQSAAARGLDINDHGHVVGYVDAGRFKGARYAHAFLYTDRMIDLGTLGGYHSEAYGLNSWGEVVGTSQVSTPDTTLHGFLYTNKTDTGGFVIVKLQERIVDLPGDFQAGILPRRINDLGVICGSAGFADTWGQRWGTEAILLTPVTPQP